MQILVVEASNYIVEQTKPLDWTRQYVSYEVPHLFVTTVNLHDAHYHQVVPFYEKV